MIERVFIPIAEKNGTIHKIGDFVLEEVCKFIASDGYQKLGLRYIEVNLSVVQCMQPHLCSHVMDILNRYHVRPEQINLEITETAASVCQQSLEDNIVFQYAEGCDITISDYQAGPYIYGTV